MELKHGTNNEGEFYTGRNRDGIWLIQINRLSIWHGYLNCNWKQSFTHKESALHWICETLKCQVGDFEEIGDISKLVTAGGGT
ncbi:MAG: hypothetical protein B7Z37_25035 [Verrucomicrobia bacterium 12-59-8]|nr:MAG: hypothetical protein B7Z37_25035 [Verrucomicrobia bacterium 12-59-8]